MTTPVFAYFFTNIQVMPYGLDPWIYFAYANNFVPLLHRFGWTYYGARISWIGFQAAFYHIFTPLVAHFLIGVIVTFAGAVSLYAIGRRYFGERAAFIAALALAGNPLFITACFYSYVDGAAITASLACIALFARGYDNDEVSTDLTSLALSGVSGTFAVLAHNIAILIIPPALLLIALYHPRQSGTARALLVVAVSASGALLLTCVVTWLLFGTFLFFRITLHMTGWVVTGGWHEWVRPMAIWIRGATGILMPIGTFLVGAVIIVSRPRRTERTRGEEWTLLYAIYFLALYAFFDFVLHAGRLQHIYYFIYLLVPTYLFLGAGIGSLLGADGTGHTDHALYTGVLLAQFVPMLLLKEGGPTAFTWDLLFALLGLIITVILWPGARIAPVRAVIVCAAVILFLFVAGASDDRNTSVQILDDGGRSTIQAFNRADYFLTVATAQQFLQENLRADRRVLFWYDTATPWRATYAAINSMYLWGYARLNGRMPELPPDDLAKIDATTSVVLLFATEPEAVRAMRVLNDHCLTGNVSGKTRVQQGTPAIQIWIVDIERATRCASAASQHLAAGAGREKRRTPARAPDSPRG